MKTLKWIALLLALVPLGVRGEETALSAKLIAVTGNVSIAVPGGGGSATVGAILPVGSAVTTTAGGQATLQFFDGTVAIVQPDSNVTIQEHNVVSQGGVVSKENTMLDLHAGGVIASLDPSKKNVTNFRVRTPKGVAAARGTVFAVRISQDTTNASVTTMSGTVTFVTDTGTYTVSFGQTSSGNGVLSVADAVKANPALAKDILDAASVVAQAVGNGTVTNSAQSPNLVGTVLAAMMEVAKEASPDTAAATEATMLQLAGNNGQSSKGLLDEIVTPSTAPTKNQNTILPPLDQTQTVVSPSKP